MLLPRETFARGAAEVAPALLGCVLEHQTPEGLVAVALTEVEAYHGQADPASHAYRGRTARNGVMFGPPGHAYVYFTYGMHYCVNLVCQPEGTASAVLLRAGRVIAGTELAARRRAGRGGLPLPGPVNGAGTGRRAAGRPETGRLAAGPPTAGRLETGRLAAGQLAAGRRGAVAGIAERDLARGPARLCKALGITRALDGADVCDPASPLRIRWPEHPARPDISQGPRIGISAAAEVPWRFWVTGDPTVSVYRPHTPRRRGKPDSVPERSDGTIPL